MLRTGNNLRHGVSTILAYTAGHACGMAIGCHLGLPLTQCMSRGRFHLSLPVSAGTFQQNNTILRTGGFPNSFRHLVGMDMLCIFRFSSVFAHKQNARHRTGNKHQYQRTNSDY
jgi:hypothetical protein